MSLVPSRLSCSGQRVSQWVKDVPEESNAEENQNRQWQHFDGYALLFASFFSTWWWTCLAFLGLLCTLFSMAWDCLYIMYTTTCYQAVCCLHELRLWVLSAARSLDQTAFSVQFWFQPSATIWALYLTRISSKCCWQAWPINLWGFKPSFQMNLGVGNLLFLFLHLICWMLNRC